MIPKVNSFERGRGFERGRSPLSLTLPSPAKKSSGLPIKMGWRGDKGEVITYQPNANRTFYNVICTRHIKIPIIHFNRILPGLNTSLKLDKSARPSISFLD
jgi:hypothetical protein